MADGFTIRDHLDVLRRRWLVIVIVMLVTLTMALAMTFILPPTYSSSATVTANTAPPVILSDQPGAGSLFAGVTLEAPPDGPALAEAARSETVRDGAIARLAPVLPPEQAKAFLRRVRVQPVRNTQLVRLTAEHGEPAIAAAMANAVAEALVNVTWEARRQRATQTRQFIERQLVQSDQQLREREQALTAAKTRLGSISLAEETTQNLDQLAQLTAQRTDLQSQHRELESRTARIRSSLSRQSRRSPTQWTPSPLIAELRNRLTELEIQRRAQSQVLTPNHPTMIELVARIEETKRRLQAELNQDLQPQQYGVDPIYQQLAMQLRDAEVALAGVVARERVVDRAVQGYETRVQLLPVREAQLARLTRDVRTAEAVYLLLSERVEEARIVEVSISSGVRIVDAARIPERPARPRPRTNILIGMLAGIMLSAAAVVFMESLDDTAQSTEHVESMLGSPALASIPFWRRHQPRRAKVELPLIIMDGHLSPVADSFRQLRTRLLAMNDQRPFRTLLITSPGPGEGKDFISANLAIAFTQTGRRVWLVEGDLRRPSLARAFHPTVPFGLTDLLRNGMSMDQAVQPTSIENLWLLPCGPQPPNPAELMGSQKMRLVLEQAHQNGAELIIINAPPVLPVPDALVLAPEVDATLLIVRVGKTPLEAVRRARDRLQEVGANLLGVVVNGVPPGRRGGYYYGERYGYGHDTRRRQEMAGAISRRDGGKS